MLLQWINNEDGKNLNNKAKNPRMEFLAAFIEQAYLTPGFADPEGLTQVANPQLYKAVLKTEQYQIGHCSLKSLKHQTY